MVPKMSSKTIAPVAVITGAARGIGAGIAIAMAQRGYRLSLSDIDMTPLHETANACRQYGVKILTTKTNVTDESAVREMVETTAERFGGIDVMVNNAGIAVESRIDQTPSSTMRRLFEINFLGVLHGCKAAVPIMTNQKCGHIFNMASVLGKRGAPFSGCYAATKFAVVGLTEALRVELMDHGVLATSVCPGLTQTGLYQKDGHHWTDKCNLWTLRLRSTSEQIGRGIAASVGKNIPELFFTFRDRLLTGVNKIWPWHTDQYMGRVYREGIHAFGNPYANLHATRPTAKGRRVAIVTGASAGIGKAFAIDLARMGYAVVLAARRIDKLREIQARCRLLGVETLCISTNVADEAQVTRLVQSTVEKFGRIDVMINNAGRGLDGRVHVLDANEVRRLLEVNVYGVFYGCKAVAPIMVAQGNGHVFNISSVLGRRAAPFNGAYSATKSALVGLTDAFRIEMAPYDVRVTSVLPGLTETAFFDAAQGGNRHAHTSIKFLHKRMAPEDVARRVGRFIGKKRREIVFTAGGRSLIWLNKYLPRLADSLMHKYYASLPQSDTLASVGYT